MTTLANTIATLRGAIADLKRAEALHNMGRADSAKAARKSAQISIDNVLDLDDSIHFGTEDQSLVESLWEEFYDAQSAVQYQATGHYYSA